MVTYQAALNLLPKRRDSRKETTRPSDEDDEEESPGPSSSNLPETQTKEDEDVEKDVPEHVTTEAVEDVPMSEDEQKEVTELRSVLFSNIGACHVKLVCCIRRSSALPMLMVSRGRAQRSCRGLHARFVRLFHTRYASSISLSFEG